jgi:Tol biopolymer transport system component
MALSAGTRLGPYEILALIGAGGMGEVYRARDTRLKRDVALKVLPEIFAGDRERLARITREAEVLASLNHPHIAAIYGVEDRALVMELAEGDEPCGPMSFDAAWHIASQIVEALEYAHDKGIVHRDLKPANVKVSAEGSVKLLDFGLAKAFTEQSAISGTDRPEQSPTLTIGATQVGVILGTAAYMSPEQAKGKTVDRRADIWAFGVMFYELLTGQRLFKGEDIADTLAQVLTRDPDLSKVPARAHKLLRRCLERDPKKRLREIGEIRHYVEEPPPAAEPPRRSRLPLLASLVAALALLLAVGQWLRPAREQRLIHSLILPPEQWSFRCAGDDAGPAVLSPDGKRLAFAAAAGDGKVQLWMRPLDSLAAQPLAGTEGAMFPFWSPNSRSVGFFADGKLKTVEASGGNVAVIADAPVTRGGSWSRDDVILFAPDFLTPIMRVSASGGAPAAVTAFDAKLQEVSHRWPWFLPDNKHFLYTSRDRGVFVASLDRAEAPRRLLPESSNAVYSAGFLLYTRANVLLARPFDASRREFTGPAVILSQAVQSEPVSDRGCFTAAADGLIAYHAGAGKTRLSWFDHTGKRLGAVGAPALQQGVEIAPDGKRAAVVISDGSGGRSVWIYEFAREIRARVISANTPFTGIVWSPDGKRLAVSLQRDGLYIVLAKDVEGSGGEEVIVRSPHEINVTQWHANGTMIFMARDPKSGWDITRLPPGEKGRDRVPLPLLHTEANEMGGVLSPDGRWLAYQSDESGGRSPEAYVASFPTGDHKRQVSTAGSDLLRWNRNGKELLLAVGDRLMAAPVRAVGGMLEVDTPRLLFESGLPCIAFEFACFDIAPDGARLLLVDSLQPRPPVVLVQSWLAALKK